MINFPGPTLITCPTSVPDSRVQKVDIFGPPTYLPRLVNVVCERPLVVVEVKTFLLLFRFTLAMLWLDSKHTKP